jgi:ABC-type glycerol-3-phosphate transport system substrate-binding protein
VFHFGSSAGSRSALPVDWYSNTGRGEKITGPSTSRYRGDAYPYGITESTAKYAGTGGSQAKLGGWHLSINPNTEKLGATIEVLKAMTTDEYYLKVFEVTGEAPPKPSLIEQSDNVPVVNRYLDTLQYQAKNQFAPPINAVWDPQKEAIGQEFHACLNQQKSPEEAVAAAQEQVEQIEEQES